MPAQDRVQAHPDSYLAELRADVRAGLTAEPKSLPPKYFYDERGSELFEEITRLPEYYPTRAETAILRARAGEIAELSRCESLVELGSGTSAKTGLLLRALRESATLREFMPFDVDPAVLADALTTQYRGLRIVPLVGDFERDLGEIPAAKGRRMIAFLGSTIGNLEPLARASLYRHVAGVLAGGDMFLLGTDLVKDTGRLLRAYNDSAGVTAEFNRNVLKVINRELRADFDVEEFEHVAIWDAEREWIEMRLRSVGAQVVTVGDLGLTVSFDAGEEMRTEVSAKFRPASIRAELAGAGFRTLKFWTDPDGDFGLTLADLAGPQAGRFRRSSRASATRAFPAQYARTNALPHPRAVYLREADLMPPLDEWFARVFHPERLPATFAQLAAAQAEEPVPEIEKLREQITQTDRQLASYRAALDGGGDDHLPAPPHSSRAAATGSDSVAGASVT